MKHAVISLLVSLATLGAAFAQEQAAPEQFTRYEWYHADYVVNDDATHVETRSFAMRVLKEAAVADAKRTSFSHSTSVEKAEVLEAYTRKADGRRVDAPPSNFQLEVNKGNDPGGPAFSDWTTVTVVFPDVAVGDTVVLRYRVTQTEAIFPNQLSFIEYFPRTYGYEDVRIRIDAPAALWARHEQRQMQEVENREAGGRRVLEWRFSNPTPAKPSRTQDPVFDYGDHPGVAWSTFRDWADIARAYGARATPKAAVTPRVQALADEITRAAGTPRDRARLLYDWVATKISYAGNCVGVGAVVPHDIDLILDNRMGDCKDHATLLEALLAAKGIRSTQALVNAGSVYRLPSVPVVSTVNHVINYLPEFDLYVDSTSPTTPFGMLPFGSADKPVLLVEGHRDGLRTPATPHASNRQVMKTRVKIRPDGSATGTIEVQMKGEFAANTRAGLRDLPADREDEAVRAIFRRAGFEGFGKLTKDDPGPLLDSYRYAVNFELQKFTRIGGTSAMAVSPLFQSQASVAGFLGSANEPEPTETFTCLGGHSIEEYVYEFPKGVKIVALPDDATIREGVLSYRATSRRKGNVVTITRTLDDQTPGNTCAPDAGRAYKRFATRVLENVRGQVIYR